jgi:hypothetical protein
MHADWLRQVDVHSVLRDKSFESKPSTYCVMECGENGERIETPFFDHVPRVDIGAPAPAMPHSVAEEILRHGGLGLGGLVPPGFVSPDALMVSLDAARCGLPLDGFPGLPRGLSLPQAMQMHALMKENPLVAREHWANIAAFLANQSAPLDRSEPPAPVVSPPECVTPQINCSVPTYDTPHREGKTGGDVSPFMLGGNSNPQSKPSSPLRCAPCGPLDVSPPMPVFTNAAPKDLMAMNEVLLNTLYTAQAAHAARMSGLSGGHASPVTLDTASKASTPSSPGRPDAGSESVDSDVPLDGEHAELLDMGDADCDAFLKTLLSV